MRWLILGRDKFLSFEHVINSVIVKCSATTESLELVEKLVGIEIVGTNIEHRFQKCKHMYS